MNRKIKGLVIIPAIVAVLGIGAVAAVASAAPPTTAGSPEQACPCGGQGAGFRFGGVVVDEVVTKLLGMTEDQIHALRLEGKSLVQIAATKNVTEKQLVDAIMAYKKTQVQARVTAKTLTQEQADQMLQRMEQATIQSVNRTTTGPVGGQGAGYGQRGGGNDPGKMNRWAR